jgi:tetratricopeptide (TPR) repeat protein
VVVAAIATTVAAQASLPVVPVAERPEVRASTLRMGRLATLGFDALVADYRWLQAVQVVGHERADLVAAAPAIASLVESVVALDPWVDHPYRFASVLLTHSRDQVERANRVLERGIAYHPEEWRNRFYLSFNHFFFLNQIDDAARELERAVELPGSPRYLGRLLARLRSEGSGGLEAARAYLEELLRQNDDPWKQAEYEKALDEIETEQRARFLDQAREVFRKRNGRDIQSVEELTAGALPVLRDLPPDLHGWGWVIDEKTGQIVSAYYGRRYRVNLNPIDLERREQFSKQAMGSEEGQQR